MSEMRVPMIYSSLTAAAASINAVGKNGINSSQGWKFRSIDDIYNALNPALISAGLTVVPKVIEKDITQDPAFTNQYGKQQPGSTTARLTMEYTVYAQDGSSVSAVVVGEGRDAGDKACNKAMAIAYKYFAFQTFCIPTEEMRLSDPDLYSPNDPAQAPQKPTTPAPAAEVSKSAPTPEAPAKAPKTAEARVKVTKTAPATEKKASRLAELTKLTALLHTDMKGVQSAWSGLVAGGKIPGKATKDLTDEEFTAALKTMRESFAMNG